MPKNRKTRKEKVRADLRRKEKTGEMFQVKEEWLRTEARSESEIAPVSAVDRKYLRLDLTKTFFLSMLVLALEIALWQYFLRR